MNIHQLVTFAILMQSGDGILGVAPSYLMEKYEEVKKYDRPQFLLDSTNTKLYTKWIDVWTVNKIGG